MRIGNHDVTFTAGIFQGYAYIQVAYFRMLVHTKPDILEIYLVDKYNNAVETVEALLEYFNTSPNSVEPATERVHSLLATLGLSFNNQSAITLAILKHLDVVLDPNQQSRILNGE